MLNSNLKRLFNLTQRIYNTKHNSSVLKLIPTFRAFSSENSMKQKSLIETASKELEELKKSYEPVQKSEKEEFLSKNRWVVFEYEKENLNYVELKKSQDEFDITVRFAAKTPEASSEERGKHDPERILDFYLTLQKNNSKSGLFVEYATIDSSVNINQIHFCQDVSEYSKNFFAGKISEAYYGPEFSILDESLQREFIELFLNFGIDDNLGSFIEVLSVDKEQRLYINWLKNVINVLH